MLITAKESELTLITPLEEEVLILDAITGYEQACQPFCFTFYMHSLKTDLDFSELIGKDVQACFDLSSEERYFSGIVGEIEQGLTIEDDAGIQTHYTAKVYPTLWTLKFSKNYQIFQMKSAVDIIKEILTENNITRFEDKTTTCGQDSREYCVQYGESPFDFICRLMEEEGIFYYFKHTAEGDILILQDDSYSLDFLENASLKIMKVKSSQNSFNQIQSMALHQQLISKKFLTSDYNFEKVSTKLYSKIKGEGDVGTVYKYPGGFFTSDDGDQLATRRLQELEWAKNTIKGESTAPALCPLFKMTVEDHPREDANRSYIVYRVEHDLNRNSEKEGVLYTNRYVAFPDDISFRSPIITPKPVIASTQTARVTGKPGEEIWCDDYGRIKVKFHWDQDGDDDDKSSCWIRVAQVWAGANWGGMWTPRVGMEVVVTFLEGNPDRPLVTGCVYNSDNPPPYVDSDPTKSTLKSQSSKDGEGYNELRFDDKKGEEEVYIQAEKDMNILVKDSRSLTINAGDNTTTLKKGDDTLTLLKGSCVVELKAAGETPGNYTKILNQGDDATEIIQGNQKVTLEDGARLALLKKGDDSLVMEEGNQNIALKKGDQSITLEQGSRTLTLEQGDEKINIKGKRFITIEEEEEHENKDDYSQKVMKNYILEIEGDLVIKVSGEVKIQSLGDLEFKSASNITMKAAQNFSVQAMTVNIKAAISTDIKAGTSLNLKSGAMANYQAGAINNIKGALVMIN